MYLYFNYTKKLLCNNFKCEFKLIKFEKKLSSFLNFINNGIINFDYLTIVI
jgi:hypothetical protein